MLVRAAFFIGVDSFVDTCQNIVAAVDISRKQTDLALFPSACKSKLISFIAGINTIDRYTLHIRTILYHLSIEVYESFEENILLKNLLTCFI